MKKYFILLLLSLLAGHTAIAQDKIKIRNDSLPTALLIIDIQEFYFPGGKLPLANPEEACSNASEVLKLFRAQHLPVIMIQHGSNSPIHTSVAPAKGEKVIIKHEANSFNGTDLLDFLKFLGVKRLVICGMQTQMCVEATTRAAYDYGFKCIVVGDACAARDLKYGDHTVSAADVQASTLATLDGNYAKVVNTLNLK